MVEIEADEAILSSIWRLLRRFAPRNDMPTGGLSTARLNPANCDAHPNRYADTASNPYHCLVPSLRHTYKFGFSYLYFHA